MLSVAYYFSTLMFKKQFLWTSEHDSEAIEHLIAEILKFWFVHYIRLRWDVFVLVFSFSSGYISYFSGGKSINGYIYVK